MSWSDDDVVSSSPQGWSDTDVAEQPKTNTLWQEAKRQGGLGLRQALSAVGSVGTIPADAIGKAVNYVAGKEVVPNQQRALQQTLTNLGMPTPERGIERFSQSVAESAPAMALPGGIVPQVLGNAAMGAIQAPPGEEGSGALWGAGGGAAAPVLGGALRAAGHGAQRVLGATTGAGTESVKQAFKGAPGFVENMREIVPKSDVVDAAREGARQLRNTMGERYANAKGGWAGDKTPLSFDPINKAADDAAKKFSFEGVPQPGVTEVHSQVSKILRNWQDRAAANPQFATVEGLDALKRHLQDVVPDNVANRTGRAYVTEVTNGVKNAITKQAPKYADAMEDYWKRSSELDEITRSLSLGDKTTTDTALRRLQTLAKPNAGQRLTSAAALEQTGADIIPQISGQAMSSWMPQGIRGVGGGAAALYNPVLAPMFSPRIVGEGARAAGKVMNSNVTQATLEALRRQAPSTIRAMNQPEE